ncbi:TetR family transcriptional regulator [Marmoricola sp. Leaf446]|uniref:TetR/AcrR family transcriptional regulator n=1 Tax=Marmoricola sp. Leaf446 TaxID=1736379 RepID=UPI0006F25374|nr:TetR/AcrR family transcriptional regulator [Marmoricola sp. Leaf446]KQT93468.1 TetR family transcriptional regulator [Marmoricola sp. Leaf446]
MAAGETRARRTRSDSERNRSGILDQAEKHFTDHGVGASLEAVARDAGVGSATLYRHFPTRDALLAELLQRRASQIEAEKERIDALEDSAAALEEWTVALEEFFAAFDGLPGPLRSAFQEEHNPLAVTCVGFIESTDHFLTAAQRDGRAPDWLRGRDIFLAALAASWVRGSSLADEVSQQQVRALLRDGYLSTSRDASRR